MNAWLQRIMVSLAVLVLVAGAARLAWELLGPVVPALIALLIAFVTLRLVLRRFREW